MPFPISFGTIVLVILGIYVLASIKILSEYERGVIFRLGRLLPHAKGPGVVLVFAPIDRIVRISLRVITMEVPPQETITRDNVTVKVNAVVYFRVLDSNKAVVEVENYLYATGQLAQTTLRSVIGEVELDELLSEREKEIVQLVAQGYRNKEIGEKLFISEQTVKNHLHNIFDKLGVSDRLELALYAIHHRLIDSRA